MYQWFWDHISGPFRIVGGINSSHPKGYISRIKKWVREIMRAREWERENGNDKLREREHNYREGERSFLPLFIISFFLAYVFFLLPFPFPLSSISMLIKLVKIMCIYSGVDFIILKNGGGCSFATGEWLEEEREVEFEVEGLRSILPGTCQHSLYGVTLVGSELPCRTEGSA